MTKFVIHIAKIIITTFIVLLFSSCKHDINFNFEDSITGSGKVITQTRNVANFDKIEINRGLDCEVTQSDQIEVIVEADTNLQDGITTTVENGTLKISSKYNNYRNVKSKKIKVKLPIVSRLETHSGSYLSTRNIIKSNDIILKSSSGSTLKATVESENVSSESSSGSTQTLAGKAIRLETSSSSGSTIDAERLLSNDIIARSSSGSSISVNPIVLLKAKASSGSNIEYAKTPKTINKEESSGGSVSLK
jgi:hypothetical protein